MFKRRKTGVNFEMPPKAVYFITLQMWLEASEISFIPASGSYTVKTTADMTIIPYANITLNKVAFYPLS